MPRWLALACTDQEILSPILQVLQGEVKLISEMVAVSVVICNVLILGLVGICLFAFFCCCCFFFGLFFFLCVCVCVCVVCFFVVVTFSRYSSLFSLLFGVGLFTSKISNSQRSNFQRINIQLYSKCTEQYREEQRDDLSL